MRSGDSRANRDRIAFWLIDESAIRSRFEAQAAGRGGIAAVSRISGIARSTIGVNELRAGEPCDASRVRRPGGGRKPLVETDPTLRTICVPSSSRTHAVIRNRRCFGPARGCASSARPAARLGWRFLFERPECSASRQARSGSLWRLEQSQR